MPSIEYLQYHHEAPDKGYWDQTLIEDLLPESSPNDKAIIILPGADQADFVDEINKYINQWPRVLLIVTTDECANFPINQLKHPNLTIWGTYMNDKYRVDRWLPIGYTPHCSKLEPKSKSLTWYFAGQITHDEREQMVKVLEGLPDGELIITDGFAKGVDVEEYTDKMSSARFVPCPAGGVNEDSFRVYEALEAGAVPITKGKKFWYKLFPDAPFPILDNWNQLPIVMRQDWQVSLWWKRYKDNLKEALWTF